MNGLEAVAHVGQGPAHDHAHRVVEVGLLHLVLDGDGRDVAFGRSRGRGRGRQARAVGSGCGVGTGREAGPRRAGSDRDVSRFRTREQRRKGLWHQCLLLRQAAPAQDRARIPEGDGMREPRSVADRRCSARAGRVPEWLGRQRLHVEGFVEGFDRRGGGRRPAAERSPDGAGGPCAERAQARERRKAHTGRQMAGRLTFWRRIGCSAFVVVDPGDAAWGEPRRRPGARSAVEAVGKGIAMTSSEPVRREDDGKRRDSRTCHRRARLRGWESEAHRIGVARGAPVRPCGPVVRGPRGDRRGPAPCGSRRMAVG